MIDPRRLRVLRALADHRTVTAAAKSLYLTPSAVSQQLASLEAEVGQQLLDRRGRAVRLTAAGEVLASHAGVVAAQLERAQADLAACASGAAGEVTVAAFATGITMLVAPAIAELAATAPRVDVRVRDVEGHASVPMLLSGEADVAVAMDYRGAPRDSDERVVRMPLFSEPFDIVLPASHRLATASPEPVPLADLAEESWITPWPGNPCHDVLLLACEHAGFEPHTHHLSDDFRAVIALVAAGAGVALVPRSALTAPPPSACGAANAMPADIVSRPAYGSPRRSVFAALRRGSERHPLHAVLLEALQHAAHRLV